MLLEAVELLEADQRKHEGGHSKETPSVLDRLTRKLQFDKGPGGGSCISRPLMNGGAKTKYQGLKQIKGEVLKQTKASAKTN